jgi:hypothetical protein
VVGSSIRDSGDDQTGLMKFAQLTKQKSTAGLGCIHSCDRQTSPNRGSYVTTSSGMSSVR